MDKGGNIHGQLREDGTSKWKCPAHNFWLRKGQCELCRLEADKRQKELERAGGSNKPEIKIYKP